MAVAVATAIGPAFANVDHGAPVSAAGWTGHIDFELSRDCPKSGETRDESARPPRISAVQKESWQDNTAGFSAKEDLAPHFTYEAGSGGPVLEIAALGGGRRENPGLAHLALGWNF
ncbi:MAG: hypothetical protein KUG65_00905 [Sphingomonadaceae bacterium]|nr:hypothetical protein [Sphingomonadaceae bacterium]